MTEQNGGDAVPSLEWCNTALLAAPFHTWLGLEAVRVTRTELQLRMPWRPEIVSNPRIGSAHGGVLGSLIDLTGFYVLLVNQHRVSATANLVVDYHRPATEGPLHATAQLIKVGRRLSTAQTEIRSADGELLASGRGAYLMSE